MHVAVWRIDGQKFDISTIGSGIEGSQKVKVITPTPHPHELHSDTQKDNRGGDKLSSQTIDALNEERKRLIMLKVVGF